MFRGFSFFRSNGSTARKGSETGSDLKHCPQCGDEYRQEFSHCAACRCELAAGGKQRGNKTGDERSRDDRDLQISPDDEMLAMRRGSLAEMKTTQRLLRKKFVASLLAEDRSGRGGGCGNAKMFELSVKKQEAALVQQILAEDYKRTTALDEHDSLPAAAVVFDQRLAQANCPACGCQFKTDDRACPECGLCF